MIRLLLAVAAALCLAGCERARDWPEPSPALWEVTGENGERGWLFGTVHALPDGVEWRTPAFEQAFAAADVVMVEIGNLGDSGGAGKAFDRLGTQDKVLPALSTRVANEDRPALAAAMERAGLEDADFRDVETWAAALMLANAVRESEPGNGVDRALLAAGKPVDALETYVVQFSRFDRLEEAAQRALLAGIAREAERDDSDEQLEAWLTGDLAALEARAQHGFLSDPALRAALLTDRNRYFAAEIGAAMDRRHSPFVAVGAAHMLGPEGLPALLAARGYTVARVQ